LEEFGRKMASMLFYVSMTGFGMNIYKNSCYENVKCIKESMIEAGLFVNGEKLGFHPVIKLAWLCCKFLCIVYC
jgi:hypothetical protein